MEFTLSDEELHSYLESFKTLSPDCFQLQLPSTPKKKAEPFKKAATFKKADDSPKAWQSPSLTQPRSKPTTKQKPEYVPKKPLVTSEDTNDAPKINLIFTD